MAWVVVWTTGPSGERRWLVRAPVVPGVERSEALGLDVKEGKGLGRKNGTRGRGPVTNPSGHEDGGAEGDPEQTA